MLHDIKEDLLLSVANTLIGNRAETACIQRAMELICSASSYHCGAVYEIDKSGSFFRMECFPFHVATLPERLEAQDLLLGDSTFLAQGDVFYIVKGQQNTASELRLLTLCSAQSVVLAPVLDEDGSLYGLVLLLDSASKSAPDESLAGVLTSALSLLVRYVGLRMYQRKLNQTQITMESILDNTGIDIYVNDFYTHEILYVNKSMAAPYGGREQLMGRKCWQALFPGQAGPCEFCPQTKLLDHQGQPTKVYTWDYQRPFDGAWFRVFSAAFQWMDGRLAHVVSSADITDNKRNEALVENMANYDQLTKLPNRRMLVKECDRRMDHASALEQGYLLFFDIDGFKPINDELGHDSGDEFLIQLGEFFSSIPLLKDSIYRNGGDEFVAIIGGEAVTKSNIINLANFIQARFKKPWKLKKEKSYAAPALAWPATRKTVSPRKCCFKRLIWPCIRSKNPAEADCALAIRWRLRHRHINHEWDASRPLCPALNRTSPGRALNNLSP